MRYKNGGLDKYYTNPTVATYFVEVIKQVLGDQITFVVEPSAGNGSFLEPIEQVLKVPYLAYDLKPENTQIIKADWFTVDIPENTTVIGNPPFGFSANLAIKFFNHAAKKANAICFIVPKTFKKTSIHKKLNENFHLIYQEDCAKNSFLLEGMPYDVPCTFQIWIKQTTPRQCLNTKKNNPYFEFTTQENATAAIRRAGGKAGKLLEGLEHTKSSTYFVKELMPGLKQALLDCEEIIHIVATSTAGVKSVSKMELNLILSKHYEDKK